MMKTAILTTITFVLVFCLGLLAYQNITDTTTSWLLLLSLSTLPWLLSNWLIPGDCAWNRHQRGAPRIPGPISWPILGSLPEMVSPLAHRKLATMATSLGAKGLMSLSLGSTRVVISSHPDTAKEILHGPSFSDRPVKESARLLMFDRAIGFAPSGDYWRHLRRIAANHMFSPKRILGLEMTRQRIAEEMLERVDYEMEIKGVVEIRQILQKGSLCNVLDSVFGAGSLSWEQKEELGLMVNEGYEVISKFNLEDYFPLIRFLDVHGVKRKSYKLASRVDSVVGHVVSQRKLGRLGRSDGGADNDFLSALLSLPEEDQLSDSDMVAVLWEMMFRGTDTVATLLEWTMARMVLHQDIQARLQHEIDTCISHQANTKHVRNSDISNLPYLQAVVKEVLRLHPPGPLLSWARLATEDVHVGKFHVPAGTTAMVNMWAITHDPSIWKDPWAFRPERFIEEEVLVMGSDLRLAPFGSGRRACPGKALGLASVHLWLARFLHQFKWLPAEPVDLSEILKLSLELKKPLKCRVIRR